MRSPRGSKQGKVRAGVLVVHGHGADGGVAASPVQKQQMREQIAAARAQRVVSEVLLLVCARGRRGVRNSAISRSLETGGLVNALDGSVFIGQATVGQPVSGGGYRRGRFLAGWTSSFPRYTPILSRVQPALVQAPQGGVVAGKWEPRGGGELTFDSSPSSALLEDDGTGTAMTPAIGQKT